MATSIVEHAMSADVGSSSCLEATEANNGIKEENMYNGNLSAFTSSSNGSYLPRGDSLSPGYKYDDSTFEAQFRQIVADSVKPAGMDGNHSKSYLDQTTFTNTSRPGTAVFEMNLKEPVYQQRSNYEQFSLDAMIGNSLDSSRKSNTSTQDNMPDDKMDYAKDYSYNTTKTNSVFDTSKQKQDQFPAYDLKSCDFQSKSQTFDFELMKQTYNIDTSNETKQSGEKDTETIKTASRQLYEFEASDLAMRLRTSVQSNFLSSEFRQGSPSKTGDAKYGSSSALRAIDDILKQYGISDNTPRRSAPTFDSAEKKLQLGHTKVTQNSEASATRTACPGASCSSTLDKDTANQFPITSNTNMNMSFKTESTIPSSYLDSKTVTASGTGFVGNISQPDQPTYKSQSSLDNDPLRKLGVYSGSTTLKVFNYGKTMSFVGDNPRASNKTFSAMDSKQFESSLDKTKFTGSQADLGKPSFGVEKGSSLDLMKNMNSTTDALENFMLNERQRLRKLDTMISATPLNYSSMDLPRSMKAQYMSPERSYSTLRSSDLAGRRELYSSSTIPLSSSHGVGVSHKSNVGKRDSSTALNKSTSVPRSGVLSAQAGTKQSSSVDVRTPYWPYNSNKKDLNNQYSSAYNPQLLEKNYNQKMGSKNTKPLGNNKKECSLKNKRGATDGSFNNGDDILSFYRQSGTGINFLGSAHGDKNGAAERKRYATKSQMKTSVGAKKNSTANYNQSKNVGGVYDGFDFVKDLNRMWQETVFGTSSSAGKKQQQKYTPYKPFPSEKEEKTGGPQTRREMFRTDYAESAAKRSESNWAVASSTATRGKHYGYESGLSQPLKSAQRVHSQCSIVPQGSGQLHNKTNIGSSAKQKTNVPSCFSTKQATKAPKSILKQSNKTSSGTSSSSSRPHSAMAAPSKSFTQSSYQLPYHLVRGFSPVELQKTGRPNASTLLKKKDTSSKRKPVSRSSAAPRLARYD